MNFIRTSGDARFYHEVVPDYVAMLRLQAGNITPWNGNDLRFNDLYQGGPNLVRGFRQNGFGPRDLTSWTTQDAIGGTNFWAASLELFIPLYFIPKDVGIRASIFADAGSVWDYNGPTSSKGEMMTFADSKLIRSVCRRRSDLGFAVRAAAVRLFNPAQQGKLRYRAGIPLRRRDEVLIDKGPVLRQKPPE